METKIQSIYNKTMDETCIEAVHSSGLTVRIVKKPGKSRKTAMLATKYGSINREFEYNGKFITIPKSRISLSKRTIVQLLIKSNDEISFKDNEDLNDFYNQFKSEIVVPKNSILGFSNTVTFEGSSSKPLELFEKSVDPDLKSDLDIELGSETIIIKYKNENLQFIDSPISQTLNNAYVYMGLQKALYRFVINNGEDGEVDLDSIDVPENGLDLKLYNLMKKKMVSEVSLENIDSVIYLISDKILEKFSSAVRGLYL